MNTLGRLIERAKAGRPDSTKAAPIVSLHEGFACRCGDQKEIADERLRWAREYLGLTVGDWFVSEAIFELMRAYDIDVNGVYASQWYGIDYSPALGDPDNRHSKARIQCDRVEDGLALLLRNAHEKWGRARPGSWRADDDPEDEPPNWRTSNDPLSMAAEPTGPETRGPSRDISEH